MAAGQAPYILVHEGEVTLFGSPEELARYIEAPDLDGARGYDSGGRVVTLSSPPVRKRFGFVNIPPVTATLTEDVRSDDLREALRSYVVDRAKLADDALTDASLVELVSCVSRLVDFKP